MQLNLPDSGTFLFISDHCHVIENVSLPHDLSHKKRQLIDMGLSRSGAMVFHKAG